MFVYIVYIENELKKIIMEKNELKKLFDQAYKQGCFDEYYLSVDENGVYNYEPYIDYRDDFTGLVINAIGDKDIVSDFQEIQESIDYAVQDSYEDWEVEFTNYIFNSFCEFLDENGYEYDEEYVRDACYYLCYFNYDEIFKNCYNVNIPLNVIIKGEDLLSYNKVNERGFSEGPGLEGDMEDWEKTSLANFMSLCGHSFGEFVDLLETGYDSANPETFIESVVVDFNNCVFPALTKVVALGGMTLNEIKDKIEKKEPVIIEKDAICGLWDFEQGTGGLFIEPDNDIEVPFGQYTIQTEKKGCIDETCGFVGGVWVGHLK